VIPPLARFFVADPRAMDKTGMEVRASSQHTKTHMLYDEFWALPKVLTKDDKPRTEGPGLL
jgi:hypothetical protein